MVLPVTSAAETVATRAAYEQRVLDVIRTLALEVRGSRAMEGVTPTASLERDVGFGSLERVELLGRLEAALGRELDDRFLLMDSAREIAGAALEAAARAGATALPHVVARRIGPATALDVDALTSVVDAMWLRATADPARVHVHLEESGATNDVTFGALRDGAARVAAGLVARSLRPGETVAIMLPTGFDFLQSFLGAMAAGLVPVPLYPPGRLHLREYLLRQTKILANAGARLLVTIPEASPVAALLRHEVPSLTGVVTVEALVKASRGNALTERRVSSPGDLALIQYTSGSTGDPKGVCLTHANLLANIRAIGAGVNVRPTDVAASWLPLYHDMGLIGTWLASIVWGIPMALMSPLAFLARPERWLWAIHQHRATLSAAPNFAFELCLRKVRDDAIEGLDLSSWRCALNGSEPVSASTVERFSRRFERYGFDPRALMPVYGLAECAVALSFPPPGRGVVVDRVRRDDVEATRRAVPASPTDEHALRFVSVGRPLLQHAIRLLDDHDREVGDRVIGRLVFRGPSALSQYRDNPAATARTVRADGWVESGDLAYRANDELFITGRAKDLIIKGGRNVLPQDIEEVAAAVDGVRKGCVVAFGVPDETAGTERLVVVAEPAVAELDARTLETAIVHAVATATGLPPDVVVIVPQRTIPKTSSGKLQRSEARSLYLTGRLGRSTKPPLALRLRLALGGLAAVVRRAVTRVGRWLFTVYLVVVGAVAAIVVGVPLWVLLAALPGRRPALSLSRVASRIALGIAWCRVTTEGLEHLSSARPLVLVSNHASFADVVALIAALPLDFVFVAKRELLAWPVIGMILRKARHLTVERLETAESVADAARTTDAIRGGEVVLFFPEGTFTRAAGLRPFRMGAFEAAVSTGASLVPIALRGTRRILASGRWIPHPGRISVWVGGPITPTAGGGWRAAIDLRNAAADAIAAHCGEPRLDLVVGGLERPASAEPVRR